MALGKSAKKVLRLVEKATGLPVQVEADPKLPPNITGQLIMARGKVPFHRVAYQPDHSASADYIIVYQCGFVLRQYAVASSDRVAFSSTDQAKQTVRDWVTKHPKAAGKAEKDLDDQTTFLFNGILSQLRSIPIGLHVDSWILDKYPDLAPVQREAVMKRLDDNAAALAPQVQERIPIEALKTHLAMSAAYAIYWAEKLGQPQIRLPYRATGHFAAGKALFDLWSSIDSDPASDRNLVDAWADKLGIKGWYKWVKEPAG